MHLSSAPFDRDRDLVVDLSSTVLGVRQFIHCHFLGNQEFVILHALGALLRCVLDWLASYMCSHGRASLFTSRASELGGNLDFTVTKARVALQVIIVAYFTNPHAPGPGHLGSNSLLAMLFQQEVSQIREMLLRKVIFVQLALFQIEFYGLG